MSVHTPGPWAICDIPPNDYWFAGVTIGAEDPSDGRRICDVFTCGATGEDIGPLHKANARLISAAPDLLEALQKILKRVEFDCSEEAVEEVESLARAAIAKATQP